MKEAASWQGWALPSYDTLRLRLRAEVGREAIILARQGQGGGKEYAYASLPTGVQAALALRWWAAEVEDGPIQKAKDGDPLSDLRWDAFLRLPKSQQAVGRKHMAALMALLELERNGASRNQAIAALRAQGAVPNRSTVFRWLKCVKGHPKIHWAQPYHDPAKARVVAGNITFPPFIGPRGLVPLRGVGQRPTNPWRKQEAGGALDTRGNRFWHAQLAHHMGKRLTVRFDLDAPRAGVQVETSAGRFVCGAPCVAAVGFVDQEAAKALVIGSNPIPKIILSAY